jgi:hypothetical protein
VLNIFISYRRSDTGAVAGRISDRLSDTFANCEVFLDVVSINPGADFKVELEQTLALSDLVLVIIGPRWAEVDPATNARRIDAPDDLVRFEVSSALRRQLVVQPILVDGARMPLESELPEDIRYLARHNALSVTTEKFRQDIQPLLKRIKDLSPGRGEALLRRFVDTPTYVTVLSTMLLTSMTVFTAILLHLGIFQAPIKLQGTNIADLKSATITRELGYLFTLNWSLFFLVVMPVLIFLLHATMQEGNRLLREINLK